MTAILDVSGVMEVLLCTEKMNRFCSILDYADFVIAPGNYVSELVNTLWKYCVFKKWPEEKCRKMFQNGMGYIDRFIECSELWQEAFAEAVRYQHPAYDLFYMVAARRYCGTLITNDGPLAKICGAAGVKTLS